MSEPNDRDRNLLDHLGGPRRKRIAGLIGKVAMGVYKRDEWGSYKNSNEVSSITHTLSEMMRDIKQTARAAAPICTDDVMGPVNLHTIAAPTSDDLTRHLVSAVLCLHFKSLDLLDYSGVRDAETKLSEDSGGPSGFGIAASKKRGPGELLKVFVNSTGFKVTMCLLLLYNPRLNVTQSDDDVSTRNTT
ncbi:hypothetical protein J6590_087421 [Homalodisca vitripennis]|nr:hypothetical protein J6590_087421 [Homalodisca vitripennis]